MNECHNPIEGTVCYYNETSFCHGRLWTCKTCGEKFCAEHWHETDKGLKVECVACEYDRKHSTKDRELYWQDQSTKPKSPFGPF